MYICKSNENGIGLASKEWSESYLLKWLDSIELPKVIYTNGPNIVSLYTDAKSKMMPRFMSPIDRKLNDEFNVEMQRMVNELVQDHGIIVYFNEIKWRWYLPPIKMLTENLPLKNVYNGTDGSVFVIDTDLKRDAP